MSQELYELPEGWEWTAWTDALEIIGGKNQKDVVADDGQYAIYGSGGEMGRATKFLCPAYTTIIGRKGTINKPQYIEQPFWNVDTAFGLAPNEQLDTKLFFYFCCSFNFLTLNRSTTLPSLTKRDLYTLKIPLPSLNEQKRIVAKLDALFTRIDTAITHLQQTLELSKALFASAQLSIFDGLEHAHQVVRLDDICTITSSKRIFKSDYVASGTPFFRTKEIVELSRNKSISTELFISNEKFEQIKIKFGVPKEGDLLFSAVGTIGVTWIVDDRQFYFKDGNLLWLKGFKGIDVAFLRESITAVLAEKIRHKSQGAAYKAISIRNLKDFQIPLPPITEQKRIVNYLDALTERVRTLESVTQEKLNDLTAFKASLLDAAFKGQL